MIKRTPDALEAYKKAVQEYNRLSLIVHGRSGATAAEWDAYAAAKAAKEEAANALREAGK